MMIMCPTMVVVVHVHVCGVLIPSIQLSTFVVVVVLVAKILRVLDLVFCGLFGIRGDAMDGRLMLSLPRK